MAGWDREDATRVGGAVSLQEMYRPVGWDNYSTRSMPGRGVQQQGQEVDQMPDAQGYVMSQQELLWSIRWCQSVAEGYPLIETDLHVSIR